MSLKFRNIYPSAVIRLYLWLKKRFSESEQTKTLLLLFLFAYPNVAYAYLDPGTGSYIFQVLIAAVIGGLFAIKMYWQKIKDFFSNHFSRKQGK